MQEDCRRERTEGMRRREKSVEKKDPQAPKSGVLFKAPDVERNGGNVLEDGGNVCFGERDQKKARTWFLIMDRI